MRLGYHPEPYWWNDLIVLFPSIWLRILSKYETPERPHPNW